MTDFTFTDSIEATAESVEDLQQDLEAHLEDILGVEVAASIANVETDPGDDWGPRLTLYARLDGIEDELEDRLGGSFDFGKLDLDVEPEPGDGDPE